MQEERLEAREERDATSSSLSSGTMNSSSSSDAFERRAVNKPCQKRQLRMPLDGFNLFSSATS